MSPAEENYSTNDREILGLVYFLKRFRCYLEGVEFEVLTDNQVLKHFFSKPNLSRRESRWLEFLGQFGITKLTLVKGKNHVLGDAPSRAPQVVNSEIDVNNVNLTSAVLSLPEDFTSNYRDDPTFADVFKALSGEDLKYSTKTARVSRLLGQFEIKDGILWYDSRICVPRANIKDVMLMAHDSVTSGHFGYSKTLARLDKYHWKNKSSDVHNYCKGCLTCQQNKDSRSKPLGEPQPLELPSRRWGSISMDFIMHLPLTKSGYDSVTTFVNRFSKRVRFVPSHGTHTATDVADIFFEKIFRMHGLPDYIVSDRDPKFMSNFWNHLMSRCGIQLKMYTSKHPQTDGSTEIMNRIMGNYL